TQSLVNSPHTKQSREPQAGERQTADKIQPAPTLEEVSYFAGCAEESITKVTQKYRRKCPIKDYDEALYIRINRENLHYQIEDRQSRQRQDKQLVIGIDGFLLAGCCHCIRSFTLRRQRSLSNQLSMLHCCDQEYHYVLQLPCSHPVALEEW